MLLQKQFKRILCQSRFLLVFGWLLLHLGAIPTPIARAQSNHVSTAICTRMLLDRFAQQCVRSFFMWSVWVKHPLLYLKLCRFYLDLSPRTIMRSRNLPFFRVPPFE